MFGAKCRNDLALKMTKAQIVDAQRLAAEFKPKKELHQITKPSKKP